MCGLDGHSAIVHRGLRLVKEGIELCPSHDAAAAAEGWFAGVR